jgi:hypothetical protein
MKRNKCLIALEWYVGAEASVQATAVSATHAGRQESKLRARLEKHRSEVKKMRTAFVRKCM